MATYGDMGIDLIKKIFELNISLDKIKIITHIDQDNNNNFINFLTKMKIQFYHDNSIDLIKKIKKI